MLLTSRAVCGRCTCAYEYERACVCNTYPYVLTFDLGCGDCPRPDDVLCVRYLYHITDRRAAGGYHIT